MRFRRRHARAVVATLSAVSIAVAGFIATSQSALASVGSDRAQVATLEQRIAAQGAHIEALVARSNQVQGQIDALDVQIAVDTAHLAADQRREETAAVVLRGVAVAAYMNGVGMGSSTLSVFTDASSMKTVFEQSDYLHAANTRVNDELNTLHIDRARTQATRSGLRSVQDRATASLRELASARAAANAAIASDQSLLQHVNRNLRSLLAAATERRHAAQLAAERALAQRAAAPVVISPAPPTSTPSLPAPPPPTPTPTPGVYADPFRAASALSSERIDQGVDYSGFGPVYAIGDGVVLSTANGGWPGGTFIAYRLTDGPANGLVVYAAEDIQPSVQVGATVTSNTVLGQIYAGPTGIETGWADPSANGDTMARTYQQYNGGNSTAFGYNFSQLLQSIGAPGGVLETNPPTGSLPQGWPHW
jgi:murein DD-endopeptidase MepM/ murein hydrolase activator NlpD